MKTSKTAFLRSIFIFLDGTINSYILLICGYNLYSIYKYQLVMCNLIVTSNFKDVYKVLIKNMKRVTSV